MQRAEGSRIPDTAPVVSATAPAARRSRVDDLPSAVALLAATRALLRARSVEEIVDVCRRCVRELGGEAVPSHLAGPDALAVDLSSTLGEPLLVRPPADAATRRRLELALDELVEDARTALGAVRPGDHLAPVATLDPAGGMLDRPAVERLLHRLAPGDAVAVLGIDRLTNLSETLGPAAGDLILASFVHVLRRQLPAGGWIGRLAGEQLVAVLRGASAAQARALLDRTRAAWLEARPHPVTFWAGVAGVTASGGAAALAEAGAALDDARSSHHDRAVVPDAGA